MKRFLITGLLTVCSFTSAASFTVGAKTVAYQSSLPEGKSGQLIYIQYYKNGKPYANAGCRIDIHIKNLQFKDSGFNYGSYCSPNFGLNDVNSFMDVKYDYKYIGKMEGSKIEGTIKVPQNTSNPLDLTNNISFYKFDDENIIVSWNKIKDATSYEFYICSLNGNSCGGYSNGLISSNFIKLPLWGIQDGGNYANGFRFLVKAYSFNTRNTFPLNIKNDDLRASFSYSVVLSKKSFSVQKSGNVFCGFGCTAEARK